jgi:hypothetical protein
MTAEFADNRQCWSKGFKKLSLLVIVQIGPISLNVTKPSTGLGEPPMPEDAYYMLGNDQQIVAIAPSCDLVIVRLGLTREERAWNHARDLAPIVHAVPPSCKERQHRARETRVVSAPGRKEHMGSGP